MHEETRGRLIGEALAQPVKNAFRLGWEFFVQNKVVAVAVMVTFLLLSVLQTVPLLGLLAGIAIGIFSNAIQIYVGRAFYGSEDILDFVERSRGAKWKPMLTEYLPQASGAWVGWLLVWLMLAIVFAVVLGLTGFDPMAMESAVQDGNGAQVIGEIPAETFGAFSIVTLIAMTFTYVYPVVQGRIILASSFSEAFNAVFGLFSPAVWRSTMNGRYFSFVLFFGLALMGASFAAGIVMTLLLLIPVVGALLLFPALFFLIYVFYMILSVANIMALELTLEPQKLQPR